MTLKEIQSIIKQNPTLGFEEMSRQATKAGVDPDFFSKAWFELYPPVTKKPDSSAAKIIWIFILVLMVLVGFDITHWHFYLKPGDPGITRAISQLAVIASSILMAYTSGLLISGRERLVFSTGLGAWMTLSAYGAQAANPQDPLVMALASFSGLLLLVFTFYAVSKSFGANFIQTLVLLALNGVFLAWLLNI